MLSFFTSKASNIWKCTMEPLGIDGASYHLEDVDKLEILMVPMLSTQGGEGNDPQKIFMSYIIWELVRQNLWIGYK